MSIPTSDAGKKSAAQGTVRIAFDGLDSLVNCYYLVDSTSYSNKATAKTSIEDAYDALVTAINSVDGLS